MHLIGALVKKNFDADAPKDKKQTKGNHKMESRKLEYLSIEMLACAIEFQLQLEARGIKYVRAATYRDFATQQVMFAQGRTTKGKIITWAKPGKSKHNRIENDIPASDAADYYLLVNDKLLPDKTEADRSKWIIFGEIGESCGLVWGGRWASPKTDRPHFQLPDRNL